MLVRNFCGADALPAASQQNHTHWVSLFLHPLQLLDGMGRNTFLRRLCRLCRPVLSGAQKENYFAKENRGSKRLTLIWFENSRQNDVRVCLCLLCFSVSMVTAVGWLAVWCSGNALVPINAVALHRARLVLGWVTAFGQVNCLIT